MDFESVAEFLRPNIWYIVGLGTLTAGAIVAWRMRWLGSVIRFAYPNARYNTIGNRYVKKDEIRTLIESNSFQEALSLMSIEEVNLKEMNDYRGFERAFDKYTQAEFTELLARCPKDIKPVISAYLEKNVLDTIKVIFRAKHIGELDKIKDDILPCGCVTPMMIYNIQDAKDLDEVADVFHYTPHNDAIKQALKGFEGDFQYFDAVLDMHYLQMLSDSVSKSNIHVRSQAKEFADMVIENIQIRTILRLKSRGGIPKKLMKVLENSVPTQTMHIGMLMALKDAEDVATVVTAFANTRYAEPLNSGLKEFEKTKSLERFEKELDILLLNRVARMSTKNTLLAGPLLRYLISKEFEIRNVKVITRGIYEKIESARMLNMVVWEDGL